MGCLPAGSHTYSCAENVQFKQCHVVTKGSYSHTLVPVSLHYRRFMSQASRTRHFARSSKEARNECEARVEGRRKRKLYVSHPLVSRFAQNAAFALLANKKRLLCWSVPGRLHKIKKEYKTAITRDDRVRLRGEV